MLLDGVRRYGAGNWENILCSYHFHLKRTAVDLKDKYRNILRTQQRQRTTRQPQHLHADVLPSANPASTAHPRNHTTFSDFPVVPQVHVLPTSPLCPLEHSPHLATPMGSAEELAVRAPSRMKLTRLLCPYDVEPSSALRQNCRPQSSLV